MNQFRHSRFDSDPSDAAEASDGRALLRAESDDLRGLAALRSFVARTKPLLLTFGLLVASWAAMHIGVIPRPLDMADYLYLRLYEGNETLLTQHVLAYVAIAGLSTRWLGQYFRREAERD